MNPTEEKGEISNEFFKKLNQQIVQKDNLIKLLQLQIRNLKSQVEEGSGSKEETAELEKALEEKSAEVQRLLEEFNGQKDQFEVLSREKDEQIQQLNRMLEEHQGGEAGTELLDDPRVPELEEQVQALQQELESERASRGELEEKIVAAQSLDATISELQQEVAFLRENAGGSTEELQAEIQQLRIAAEASKVEMEQLGMALQGKIEEVNDLTAKIENVSEDQTANSRVLELEQDLETLRNLLAEKDEALANSATGGDAGQAAEIIELQTQLSAATSELEQLRAQPAISPEIEDELVRLREESSQIEDLRRQLSSLEAEAASSAEMAMKITALESEREQMAQELEKSKAQGASDPAEVEALKAKIQEIEQKVSAKESEIAELRVALESSQSDGEDDSSIKEEIEQLTAQIADQLLAIQNFEGMLQEARNQVEEKDREISVLRSQAHNSPQQSSVIPVDGESDIITSLLDFFDGLDSLLSRNPIPELQTLHQKLLDRLIIPNQIAYMPVISEEFNAESHLATDYFTSDRFPEKCVVFEVEKGYMKGDTVVKKAKVWVVQNLFQCQACNAMQSNSDSRFCHMCGAKIIAPNGLPVDSLPVFEPTPTTYLRFAERMLEKDDTAKAREYLESGLELDSNFFPLMVKLGDLYAAESNFEEAIDVLARAVKVKADPKLQEKIQEMQVKLNIFKQAQTLHLNPEELDKLVHLIKK